MHDASDAMRPLDVIQLEHDYKEFTTGLEHEFADPAHVDRTVKEEALVLTPSRTICALLLKDRFDSTLCDPAYSVCMAVAGLIDKRPAAVGSRPMPRITKNGRGKFLVTPKTVMDILDRDDVRQGLLGAVAGTSARAPRISKLMEEHPELLDPLRPVIERADDLYSQYLPNCHAFQRKEIKLTPQFRLWRTALSSLYIPKNLRSGYHRDGSNLLCAMSILIPLGDFRGGELVLPRWRIACALRPGDILLFDPQQLHGNLLIHGSRASIVGYCARGLSEWTH